MQAFSIDYTILHHTGKFNSDIQEWNRLPQGNNTWIFKIYFCTLQHELHTVKHITAKEAGIHHANIVCNVTEGLQELLLQVPPNEVHKDASYIEQPEESEEEGGYP